jgi:TRAP-type C4-dicarboxylate transport system permease small subunit
MTIERMLIGFKRFNTLIARLMGAFVVAMMGFVSLNVFLRYVMRSPISWPIEVSEYLLVITVFLPACYTLLVGRHIEVEIGVQRMPPRMQIFAKIATSLLALFYCGSLTWESTKLAARCYKMNWLSESGSDMPLFPFYASVPVGSVLLFIGLIAIVTEQVLILKRGQFEVEADSRAVY